MQARREWIGPLRAFGLSLACVYGPHFLPLATGMIQECDHCLHEWTRRFPVLPGMLVSTLLHASGLVAEDAREVLVPSLATAGILVLATLLVSTSGRVRTLMTVVIASLAAAHAFALANAFRM